MIKSKIKSTVVADSINRKGNRVTTIDLTFPRFILAELATHRVFSMNSASSRAIPLKKMIASAWNDPFIPILWMKDHKGMQGTEYFDSNVSKFILKNLWLLARCFAIVFAWLLNKVGLTKQICNRLLEPFMWHSVILTGTEFENFFNLRIHPEAEIHIQALAESMRGAMDDSEPVLLSDGDVHIPFSDMMDIPEDLGISAKHWQHTLIKIAVARCARRSYETLGDNPKIDYKADINLHDRLLKMKHLSPFEHVAICREDTNYANFKGWQSYRNALGH